MYINSINYFRGISIIFIVFGHCLTLADYTYDSIAGNTLFNLTKGGTVFFVFISGFLFHHIFYEKFRFKDFIMKKTKYVLVPYLILSTIPIVHLLISTSISGILSSSTFSLKYESLLSFPILNHYFTGSDKNFVGYWYIPFIIIVFVMSPIFIRFIQLRLKTQILTTLLLLICSIFMHRGTYLNAFSVFQNVLFFTPVYLLGIILSKKKDLIYSKLTGKEFYILSLPLTLAIIQAYIGRFGTYHKAPFTFGGIDLMIIQKILLCLFFMIFLNRFENYKLRFLEIIAANSFGVYFTHGIIISFFTTIKKKLDFSFTSNSFITYCLVTILIFFISIIATLFVKRLFPKYSRYLIGS
ncbi:MAG: surface polysaccharide O-acyltransferase-like enzyme [Spirosomataceae bacterium]|jgi:surface polysaccharide O-acyltransferase-like enzyme